MVKLVIFRAHCGLLSNGYLLSLTACTCNVRPLSFWALSATSRSSATSHYLSCKTPFLGWQTSTVTLAPGEVIYRQGDVSSNFYLIERGEVQMSLTPDSDNEDDEPTPIPVCTCPPLAVSSTSPSTVAHPGRFPRCSCAFLRRAM